MTDRHIPPRMDGEPLDAWLWLCTWLRCRDWAEPFEATAAVHAVTPAAVATAAARWQWDARASAPASSSADAQVPAPVPAERSAV